MTTRGSSVRLRRSLKARILASSGIVFFGLAVLVAFLLPRVFESQLRDELRRRTESAAKGVAAMLADTRVEDESVAADDLLKNAGRWLEVQDDLESALVLDGDGGVIGRWPADSPSWFDGRLQDGQVLEGSSYLVATAPLTLADGRLVDVAVRASTANLVHELENVRWLFASIILLGGAAFFVLTKYLTQTILQPLEDIRLVAQSLADGEPTVQFPTLADDEIAELGGFLRTLGDNRRHSRILRRPWFHSPEEEGSDAPGGEVFLDPEPNPPGRKPAPDRMFPNPDSKPPTNREQ